MKFDGLALPMRCQPPHYGHLKCIVTAARLANEVKVFLCRECGTIDDPFPLNLRRKWLQQMVNDSSISNVEVVDRSTKPSLDRFSEYWSAFTVKSVVVLTTHETDEMYRRCGFVTFNHHELENTIVLYGKVPSDLYSTGRNIRSRLRLGLSCRSLLPEWVELQARKHLQT